MDTLTDSPKSPLLTRKQAAEYLHAQPQTLNYWRAAKKGPAAVKIGKKILYLQSDLDAYIENCRS